MQTEDRYSFADSAPIKDQLPFESKLATDYYDFLMRVDPMQLWGDVQPHKLPIETENSVAYDSDQVAKLAPVFPGLTSELAEADEWGKIASALGFRYAWTRVHMHMKALTHMQQFLDGKHAIIEPGIGAGGIIHFLPSLFDLTYYGIDCSPVALDVCRKLEQSNSLSGRRALYRANYYAFHVDNLSRLGIDPSRTIVFLSNFLSNGNSIWHTFPCIDPFIVAAWLVSYWVNAGATVLICERCDDTAEFVQFLVNNGRWDSGAQANVLDEFDTYSTYGSNSSNPVGEWRKSKCVVASFKR